MLINGRFLAQRVTGVQRFAREIVRAGARAGLLHPGRTRILAPAGKDMPEIFAGLPVTAVGKHGGQIWEQLDLARALDNDALINLCNTGPMFARNQMVVLHDAAVAATPRNYTLAFRAWYKLMIRAYGHSAKTIGTVSKFSAGEIVRHFGIDRHKIEIIPESGEHILDEAADDSLHERHGLEQNGYFLAVSSMAANKNFAAVVKAAARLRGVTQKFVIVGGRNTRIFNAADFDTGHAVEVGYASDGQLRALYERAACFVYPSLYEGFGLPPLEAMRCGCPTLVSNAASLPETCGKAAVYCDPHDPEDIAKQLARILGSDALRDELRAAGLAHAKEWTWEKAARRLVELNS